MPYLTPYRLTVSNYCGPCTPTTIEVPKHGLQAFEAWGVGCGKGLGYGPAVFSLTWQNTRLPRVAMWGCYNLEINKGLLD